MIICPIFPYVFAGLSERKPIIARLGLWIGLAIVAAGIYLGELGNLECAIRLL